MLGWGVVAPVAAESVPALGVSVYATADDVVQHLAPAERREVALARLRQLQVSRVFLEGRRGDEHVPPATLEAVRDWLAGAGIRSSGGIATVPGTRFGVRQNEGLGWLNWEAPGTRRDLAGFFAENAPVFDTLIVDDFFCTGDTSPASEQGRAGRSWSAYRRDLLVSLIEPLMLGPARRTRPDVRMIIKFPQWYDRFHLFGYDPERMARPFDEVWVGTEVRNPLTRRMGYVQPTEGYVNFRWITSVCGPKVRGAWFDHIECTPANFVDQAIQSVLAGAQELTLFRLGDLMEGHPGDALLAGRLEALKELAAELREGSLRGVPCYKPPNSEAADNLYLMDYLAVAGIPVLPVAQYPGDAPVVILLAQAASDPAIRRRVQDHLGRGARLIVTPAFLRAAGEALQELAGVRVEGTPGPVAIRTVHVDGERHFLTEPLDADGAVTGRGARVRMTGLAGERSVPVLLERRSGKGRVVVLNVRTFDEEAFRSEGEWLLSPKPLGWMQLPRAVANALRRAALDPLGVRFDAPGGAGLYLLGQVAFVHNFRDESVEVRVGRERLRIPAHDFRRLQLR